MKRLGKKLHSERGASLVMAMLLLLVCMMVASSILAAAASNAGKQRSNRAEQQKYLTLSSALRLVCGELEKAEYKGKYTVCEWDVTTPGPNPGDPPGPTVSYFHVEQTPGEYGCDQITDQLPLGEWLDKILSEKFADKASLGYKALTVPAAAASAECTLTVTLPDSLGGYPYDAAAPGLPAYQVPETVTVRVKLDRGTQSIRLKAWLGDSPDPPADSGFYTMEAELVAVMTAPLTPDYNPGGRTPDSSPPAGVTKTGKEIPITWMLNWMKKEVP